MRRPRSSMTARVFDATPAVAPAAGDRESPPGRDGQARTANGERPWHMLAIDEVLTRLVTTPEGLRTDEATRRQHAHGPNELQASEGISAWRTLAAQFRNVLIL